MYGTLQCTARGIKLAPLPRRNITMYFGPQHNEYYYNPVFCVAVRLPYLEQVPKADKYEWKQGRNNPTVGGFLMENIHAWIQIKIQQNAWVRIYIKA
jgi:hypothetical protein